jgi:hypothetical protein
MKVSSGMVLGLRGFGIGEMVVIALVVRLKWYL